MLREKIAENPYQTLGLAIAAGALVGMGSSKTLARMLLTLGSRLAVAFASKKLYDTFVTDMPAAAPRPQASA